MKLMETLTGSTAKIFGACSHHINKQKAGIILSKTAGFCTKLVSDEDDSSIMMQYYTNLPKLLSTSPARKVIHCLPLSKSEIGLGTETTGIRKSVRVKFQLQKECKFADQIFIVGDDPILGSWKPSEAIPFNWSEGHIWSLVLELPVEKSIQYKLLLKKSSGDILWQSGSDSTFRSWETKNIIVVSEDWGNTEAQKITEEQQIFDKSEEHTIKTLVEASVLDPPKNPSEEVVPAVSSHIRVLGSEENAGVDDHTATVSRNMSVENAEKGAHPKENPPSSAIKKSRSSDRNAEQQVPARKSSQRTVNVDLNATEVADEGSLVTCDEGPVLVPGLTLPGTSPAEAVVQEHQIFGLDDASPGADAPKDQNSPDVLF